ncbi:MAG: bifunctional DNA-formamidopyrimidine glycosylase/DNA-(apurinic or apyrimidinic site) lyase [Candidatus Eremiobacteraeota bacterium]|nr:bifunctional DNA-formamidopyrimidine glycosylase/DNA-(apurinic or apyrimidinic site) lyase [Candidatus Eremiobacteraeota bacterium]
MPELPEVETIARGLAGPLTGQRIAAVCVNLPKVALVSGERAFTTELTGERIAGVQRRGKFIVLSLRSGRSLVVHLRMTGRLILQPPGQQGRYPHTHVKLRLGDGSHVCFADVRQFGRMRLVEPEEPWASELGYEPLSQDFTAERFIGILAGRTTPVKVLLLDQRRIAGIGNIYACEALWQARIRPGTPAKVLTKPAIRRLREALAEVLNRAIEMGGSSVDDYVNAQGLQGAFQNVLSVYGREGQPCRRCGRAVVRTVIAQRGTWWCRKCQK